MFGVDRLDANGDGVDVWNVKGDRVGYASYDRWEVERNVTYALEQLRLHLLRWDTDNYLRLV